MLDLFVAWLQRRVHVRVHVGDEEILVTVVVEVERADSHRAVWRLRKVIERAVGEPAVAEIHEVVIVALHVQHVEIGNRIAVEIH